MLRLDEASRRDVVRARCTTLQPKRCRVQKVFQDKKAELLRAKGTGNCANLMTKVLDGRKLWACLQTMSVVQRTGRSGIALRAAV